MALLGLWTLAAVSGFPRPRVVPTPGAVIGQLWVDRHIYPTNIAATVREAGIGWLWGNLAALLLGVAFLLVPPLQRLLERLVIALYVLPVAAVAPLLQITLNGDAPKSALAAQAVLFTTLVGVSLGLNAADAAWLEIVRASGGGRWTQFVKVRVRAAIPATFAGLQIAAPAAILGAVIGEYLGGQRGLGVAMIISQQSFEIPRTWGLALVTTAVAGVGFVLTGAVGRRLAGAPIPTVGAGRPPSSTELAATRPGRMASRLRRRMAAVAYAGVSIAIILAAWAAAIHMFGLKPFVAKTPLATLRYLVRGPTAVAHRRLVINGLRVTLRDSGLGLGLGLTGAVVVAVAVVSNRTLERAFMPTAIALRSIPLVALIPVITLVFGRDVACVAVTGGLVTFFPALINVVVGLRTVPAQALELIEACGSTRWQALVKIRLPYALPSVFAALRVAAPVALLGAVLAEWLATGRGLGDLMIRSISNGDFGAVWASVAVLTAFSIAFYGLAATTETAALKRFAGRA